MSQQTRPPIPPVPQANVQSMSGILLAPLNEFQALSNTLFLSLSPPQSKPPPRPSLTAFLECDKAIADAINLAHAHQIKQRKIDALEAEILDLESQWRDICVELNTGKAELEELIEEGDERIKAIDEAKKASIPYPELLAYAQKLSAFTSAPPNMPDINLPNGHIFFPPFPNEELMRRGHLNAEAPLGPLGETHSVGRPPTTSPKIETNHNIHGANPYRHDIRAPQAQSQFLELDLDLNPDL